MTDFAKDVDFRGNKIKRAKVEILDRTNIDQDAVIDKQYVDDVDTYNTQLTADLTVQPNNEILDRTKLHNKSTKQIFDELFYKIINHDYEKPIIDLSYVFYVAGSNTIVNEPIVGSTYDVKLSFDFDLLDSIGLQSSLVEISGTGILGQVSTANTSFIIPNYVVKTFQQWTAKLNYLQAFVRTNSRHLPDTIGTAQNPYFGAGSITTTVSCQLNYSWYAISLHGDVQTPTALNLASAMTAQGRFTNAVPNQISVMIPPDTTRTIFVAIPYSGAVQTLLDVNIVKDFGISVTDAFTKEILYNVPVGTSFINYVIFRGTTGIGFTNVSTYTFNL